MQLFSWVSGTKFHTFICHPSDLPRLGLTIRRIDLQLTSDSDRRKSQKKWRHSEHAPASNTGLSLFPPGLQAHFQGRVRGSPGTGLDICRDPRDFSTYRQMNGLLTKLGLEEKSKD